MHMWQRFTGVFTKVMKIGECENPDKSFPYSSVTIFI